MVHIVSSQVQTLFTKVVVIGELARGALSREDSVSEERMVVS